jgi:hypothetical protein
MIKEAIEKIISLAPPNVIKGTDGLERTDKDLKLVKPPTPEQVSVLTLLGFTQVISEKIEAFDAKSVFIHVENHLKVALVGIKSDQWGRRPRFLEANCADDVGKFTFGNFQSAEPFIIGLQACFVPGAGDIDYVLRVASNLAAEAVTTADDDGISQRVGMKAGVVLKSQEVVKARVKLAPYRTFREVEQPVSEFILRLRSGREGEVPTCGLFEADGGRWKLDTVQAVSVWLSRNITDIGVVA